MSWSAETYLAHSAKGTTWSKKDHKYVRKDGDRYIYETEGKEDTGEAKHFSDNRRRTGEVGYFLDKMHSDKNWAAEKDWSGVAREDIPIDKKELQRRSNNAAKALMEAAKADYNKEHGAGGMPSSVANMISKVANMKLEQLNEKIKNRIHIRGWKGGAYTSQLY